MKRSPLMQFRAVGFLLCALACFSAGVGAGSSACAQVASDTAQLLGKAHALETRGRMDMARQVYAQVLLADPNNADALAGMARAAKTSGNIDQANQYLARLRAVSPNNPNIAQIENMGTAQDTTVQLRKAGQLSAQGQYARAMAILKQVYGDNPPAGDAALSYYQTEAAVEDMRPQAIAGLRALADKYPSDPRYEIALGKILTYNPRTRAEGRKLLARHPNDPEATEALRQALLWDSANPRTAGDIRAYVARHPDEQLRQALQQDQRAVAASRRPALTPEQQAAQDQRAAQGREIQQAYAALNAKQYEEAEQRFQAILAKNPNDAKALAGMGYLRMQQANFAGAISFLSNAEQNGAHDAGLEKALSSSRFYYTMRAATGALAENDLATATQQSQAAVNMRPTDATALQGLGGTLLKAGQSAQAISLYTRFVRLHPEDLQAWRGLFLSYAGNNQFDMALGTERKMPVSVRTALMRDPDYLRTLASVYQATNRDADAQRVLAQALQLPFPANGRGLQADVQMQYAGLLEAAGRHEQAAGLYRQVLQADSTKTDAWVGLVETDHSLGNDADAFQQLQSMPPASYQQAMQEPGFATTVAAIYMSQGHDDLAQSVLEEFLENQEAQHEKPFVAAQVTLANLYLKHGNTVKAFPLFENILTNNPDRPDAWKGLLNSLHGTGHDQEALAEIQQMPQSMRLQLEADPDYLQLVGSIYAALGHPQDAMRFLGRVQQHYAHEGVAPPSDVDIQTAWLLFNSGNDPALYKQLMMLGGRPDLTAEQRRTIQTIWASWAVRRSQQAIEAKNPKRAIAILNAAAQAFPNNPGVLKALGSGYAAAGLPKEAVQIFRAQDLARGTATDYRAAVGAALVANDLKDAETWLRFGLDQYPRDAQLLGMAAKFEQARGNPSRAADYYRASLKAMPGPDPGAELAEEMAHAPAPARLPQAHGPQDLASLLAQPETVADVNGVQTAPQAYLPSYGNQGGQAPVVLNHVNPMGSTPGYHPQGYGTSGVSGDTYANPPASTRRSGTSTLGQYEPQSSVMAKPLSVQVAHGAELAVLHLHADPAMEAKYGPYRLFVPGETMPGQADGWVGAGSAVRVEYLPVSRPAAVRMIAAAFQGQAESTADGTPIVPYVPVAQSRRKKPVRRRYTQAGEKTRQTRGQSAGANSDGTAGSSGYVNPFANFGDLPAKSQTVHPIHLPTHESKSTPERRTVRTEPAAEQPKYVPPPIFIPGATTPQTLERGQSRRITYPHTERETVRRTAAERAAEIRRNQSNAPEVMEGTSHPPVENYKTDEDNPALMNPAQYNPARAQGAQVPQPQIPSRSQVQDGSTYTNGQTSAGQTPNSGQWMENLGGQNVPPTAGQQYPQPRRRTTRRSTTTRRSRSRSRSTEITPVQPVSPEPTQQRPMTYPVYSQPLQNEGTPEVQRPYPQPTAPTDEQLQEQNVPPLRGYFDPRVSNNPRVPLTARQQTQLDLALIEASTSSWLGGTAIGSYRSGTAGVDRLMSLTVPFEASFAVGSSVRFNFVPQAVFLNAGQLVLPTTPNNAPLLGTMYDNVATAPTQQFATGVGGELQMVTHTISAALGYSPYGFPVSNLIGRARWRPGNWHFTFFGGRDPVKETMLSYAGMRDPNINANGAIWGGVVASGGGVRFDAGDEHSGLYLQMEGADLTGYHVLENKKFDGTMGAYFRVATWPEYGSLNIGGTLFGEHFDYNERGETYGLGGYFSPNAYFLAAVPITYNGHYMENLHYTINGSVGLQTFQEDKQVYFPLDPAAQAGVPNCNGVTGVGCGLPVNSNTGLNYAVDSEMSYQVNDHWYIGAFVSGNNTNNYNTISGGAFARYTFRPQVQTTDYPTGLFPVEGFRPLRVP